MVCSCGKCIAGILSPRMACRLERTAASSSDMILDSLPNFHGNQAVHDPEVYLFDYVPPELRIEVTRQFCVGFANCMATAAYLSKQGQLPKPRLLAQMMNIVPGLDKSASEFYLEKNGTPEYALDAVLARVEEEYEGQGDGSFVQEESNAKALAALPVCRNDDQFQLLRQQLFSNSDFWPCGPYGFDDDEEEQRVAGGGGGGAGGVEGGDGWTYYDTSNWKPPAAAAAAPGRAPGFGFGGAK